MRQIIFFINHNLPNGSYLYKKKIVYVSARYRPAQFPSILRFMYIISAELTHCSLHKFGGNQLSCRNYAVTDQWALPLLTKMFEHIISSLIGASWEQFLQKRVLLYHRWTMITLYLICRNRSKLFQCKFCNSFAGWVFSVCIFSVLTAFLLLFLCSRVVLC